VQSIQINADRREAVVGFYRVPRVPTLSDVDSPQVLTSSGSRSGQYLQVEEERFNYRTGELVVQ